MPATLSQSARRIWETLAPICVGMGTLTVADLGAFAALCELQVTLQCACAQKDSPRFRAVNARGKIHPALKLERDTAAALRPYYEKFGLDPIGRARIQLPTIPEPAISKWAGILK